MRDAGASAHSGGVIAGAAASPSDRALNRLAGWYAIALRVGSALAFAIAGPLAAIEGTSSSLLTAVLAVLCGWAAVFALLVRRYGLRPLLVAADAAVIVALLFAHSRVVPAVAISGGTTWMLPLASTAIFIPQLALPPSAGLPIAGIVTAAYALTVRHPTGASFLVIQALVTAALMVLVRRGGRSADSLIARNLRAEQEMRAEAARRADEKEQYRQLHDTILSTLTMIAAGSFAGAFPTLQAQAARDLGVLRVLPAFPGTEAAGGGSLADRLREAAAQAGPLRVRLSLPEASPPPDVTEHIAGCAAEALRNVAQHAGAGEAEIRAESGGSWARVVITDHGKGFDPAAVPRSRRGISESIQGRMAAAGGAATVISRPGEGTSVLLRWPA